MKAGKIQAVENGLRYAIKVKDEPFAEMNLIDRMAFYKVPGLNIAVIND